MMILSLLCLLVLYAMASPASGRSRRNFSNNHGDFGSGGGKTKVSTVSDTYGRLREPFVDYLSTQIGKPGPVYTGKTTAPITSQEQASLGKVDQYANTGYGDTFKAGAKQITDTLGGNYDPSTSPYYQAVKAQAAQNLSDTKRGIASDAAGAGRYFTGSRIKQQARASTESELGLNTILGQLAENERQRQISLVPQALSYGQAEQQLPLQQATALQSLGALPRTLEQNTLNSQLENFYKSQYDYPLNILSLIAGVQAPPTQTVTPQNSMLQNLTQGGLSLATLAALRCWVAEQVLGDGTMFNRKVDNVRYFINFVAPIWFKELYVKHGIDFAIFIKDKPLLKVALRPLFMLFARIGKDARHV